MDKFTNELNEAMNIMFEYDYKVNKKAHDYGCGILLHLNEIHTIEAIGNYAGSNSTEIASHVGFTKGTVSKLTSKLERLGLIRRYQVRDNRKETYFSLTELGQKAFDGHYAYHEAKSAYTHEQYRKYTEEQRAIILEFIRIYTKYLEDYL